ncbi:MAG TPA: hypothetical protein VLX92_15100 [Kofleriaceae bacterium]|nr:hypothetical protein [Kofleriaceae bacterium]
MRDNEATRAADVLGQLRDGDRAGLLDALRAFWLAPPERDDAAYDDVQGELWQALCEAGCADAARAAGLELVRARTPIRPSAFADLVEGCAVAELVELAELVLEAGWDRQRCFGAIALRLVDTDHHDALRELIAHHRERVLGDPRCWLVIAFMLTATRFGNRSEVSAWLDDWTHRDDVPMWIVAAYAVVVLFETPPGPRGKADRLARDACARLPWDDSAPLLLCVTLAETVRSGALATFATAMRTHDAMLAAAAARPHEQLPAAVYATRIVRDALRSHPPLAALVANHARYLREGYAVLSAVLALHQAQPRDRANLELARTLWHSRPGRIAVAGRSRELIASRLTWLQRLRVVGWPG